MRSCKRASGDVAPSPLLPSSAHASLQSRKGCCCPAAWDAMHKRPPQVLGGWMVMVAMGGASGEKDPLCSCFKESHPRPWGSPVNPGTRASSPRIRRLGVVHYVIPSPESKRRGLPRTPIGFGTTFQCPSAQRSRPGNMLMMTECKDCKRGLRFS